MRNFGLVYVDEMAKLNAKEIAVLASWRATPEGCPSPEYYAMDLLGLSEHSFQKIMKSLRSKGLIDE
jgi:hypothetical protein